MERPLRFAWDPAGDLEESCDSSPPTAGVIRGYPDRGRRRTSCGIGPLRQVAGYSNFSPDSFTTFAQRAFSSRMNAPNCADDCGRISAPEETSFSFISGEARIAVTVS